MEGSPVSDSLRESLLTKLAAERADAEAMKTDLCPPMSNWTGFDTFLETLAAHVLATIAHDRPAAEIQFFGKRSVFIQLPAPCQTAWWVDGVFKWQQQAMKRRDEILAKLPARAPEYEASMGARVAELRAEMAAKWNAEHPTFPATWDELGRTLTISFVE